MQFGVNKNEKVFQEEQNCQASAICSLEKFTSVYLYQITWEINHNLLFINDLHDKSITESQTDEILTVQSCHNFARLVITVLELRSSLPMKT